MNKEDLIERCLIDKDAIVTYPFKDKKYVATPILRHKSNEKWFGIIFEMDNELCINLKAHPLDISALLDQYPDCISPAWHMNKKHWCKIKVNKIDLEILDAIIKTSFEITAPKRKTNGKALK